MNEINNHTKTKKNPAAMLVCNFAFFMMSSYYKTYSVKVWVFSIFCIAGIEFFGGPIWRVV